MKTAVMYGAGNIGRGFIGERFYLSGYHTVFVDINDTVISLMNENGCYPIYTTDGDRYSESVIENISALNGRDSDSVSEKIAQCDVMATAVGVNVLPYIISNIASGIFRRYECSKKPLNIIICENMIDCDLYLRNLINIQLEKMNSDKNVIDYFNESVGLIEASVGRMVPRTPHDIKEKNPLSVCVEPYCTLPVDADAIRGSSPEINEVYQINGIQPEHNFELFIRRKLFMHNMSHAILAYLGFQKGYTYISEAAEDAEIYAIAENALDEAKNALISEYLPNDKNGKYAQGLDLHKTELLVRFRNALLRDTILRVGKDTKRKLSINDRLSGAYILAAKHGIDAKNISLGIKAALKFNPPEDFDPESHEVFEYASKFGEEAAKKKYCGI